MKFEYQNILVIFQTSTEQSNAGSEDNSDMPNPECNNVQSSEPSNESDSHNKLSSDVQISPSEEVNNVDVDFELHLLLESTDDGLENHLGSANVATPEETFRSNDTGEKTPYRQRLGRSMSKSKKRRSYSEMIRSCSVVLTPLDLSRPPKIRKKVRFCFAAVCVYHDQEFTFI